MNSCSPERNNTWSGLSTDVSSEIGPWQKHVTQQLIKPSCCSTPCLDTQRAIIRRSHTHRAAGTPDKAVRFMRCQCLQLLRSVMWACAGVTVQCCSRNYYYSSASDSVSFSLTHPLFPYNHLNHIHTNNWNSIQFHDLFWPVFPNTLAIYRWSVKQKAPPYTHAIGQSQAGLDQTIQSIIKSMCFNLREINQLMVYLEMTLHVKKYFIKMPFNWNWTEDMKEVEFKQIANQRHSYNRCLFFSVRRTK